MADEVQDSKGTTPLDEVDLLSEEQPEKPRTPLERILQSLKQAHQGSLHPSSSNRKELGKDKSKSLFVLVVAAVVVLLFFLAVFAAEGEASADGGAQGTTGSRPESNPRPGAATRRLGYPTAHRRHAGPDIPEQWAGDAGGYQPDFARELQD